MEHIMLECAREADRDTLAMILVRNGYTVRRSRMKAGKGNTYTHFIECWKEGKAVGQGVQKPGEEQR